MKIGDKVWFATDPEHTTEGLWALCGDVIAISMRETDSGVDILEYQINLGTFDEYVWRKKEEVFPTEKEAVNNSKFSITEKIDKLERRLAKYKELGL